MKELEKITAADIDAAIRRRFSWPEWVVFSEVPNGAYGARRADVIAMNLWASRAFEIMGFEIKVDRRDLLRELADPAKADETGRYCDKWALATPAGLVKDGDYIPEGWGLLELYPSDVFKWRVKPAKRAEVKPVDRSFASVMIRRAAEQDELERRAAINSEAKRIAAADLKLESERHEQQQQFERDRHERTRKQYNELMAQVSQFEQQTGLRIREALMGDSPTVKAVEIVNRLGVGGTRGIIDDAVQHISTAQELLNRAAKVADMAKTLRAIEN